MACSRSSSDAFLKYLYRPGNATSLLSKQYACNETHAEGCSVQDVGHQDKFRQGIAYNQQVQTRYLFFSTEFLVLFIPSFSLHVREKRKKNVNSARSSGKNKLLICKDTRAVTLVKKILEISHNIFKNLLHFQLIRISEKILNFSRYQKFFLEIIE